MAQQINLYQPAFRKQEKPFSSRRVPAALALVVAGMGALYAYAWWTTRSAERLVEQYTLQVGEQRKMVSDLGAKFEPRTRSKALESDVAKLEGELQARQHVLGALSTGELGNTVGFSEFFAALGRRALPGVWLTGVSISDAGNSLLVHGRALKADLVPAYIKGLGEEPMMRGRRVTELKLAARVLPPPAEKGGEKAEPRRPGPDRFVEFTLSAPLHVAQVEAAPAKPGPIQ